MRRFITVGVAALAIAGAGTGVAHAATTVSPSCNPVTTQPFAALGDTNSYFLVPGGNFENGAPGWTLAGGAALAAGNNTAGGDPATNSTSLSLPAGGSATGPSVCVPLAAPWMRFFVKNTGKASSRLGVSVIVTGLNGKPATVLVATVSGTGTWQVTPQIAYAANVLALFSPTGTTSFALRFAPLDATGQWSVDDVYVDPIKHR